MVKVFLSCPYTGDEDYNLMRSIDYTNKLIALGFAVFNPLLYHYCDEKVRQPYETWAHIDVEFMLVCDCVLRISGISKGADKEVRIAEMNGIPVYYSITNLLQECS